MTFSRDPAERRAWKEQAWLVCVGRNGVRPSSSFGQMRGRRSRQDQPRTGHPPAGWPERSGDFKEISPTSLFKRRWPGRELGEFIMATGRGVLEVSGSYKQPPLFITGVPAGSPRLRPWGETRLAPCCCLISSVPAGCFHKSYFQPSKSIRQPD